MSTNPASPGERVTDNKEVFDRIAPGWYNLRHRSIFRSELEVLAKRWRQGRLLNVGCAHGPDFPPFREGFERHGVDFSRRMLEFARKYAAKYQFDVSLVAADARYLPYTDNSFEWAIAVATYHHIEGIKARLLALRELRRVLRPGGEAFITVWNRWQPRFWFRSRDTLVPWRNRDETIYRYYHLFSYREMKRLIRDAGFELVRIFPESRHKFPIRIFSRNICALVRKSI
jgi:tRNA (uracil-5-)-methyltransferase TRM9